MLVDDKCRALLEDIPARHALDFQTQVFSKSNGTDFLAYLATLETEADPAVLSCVREVYGDDWPQPYLSMYEDERNRESRS